jgi:hypothetical protein
MTNGLLERIARSKDQPTLSKGVSEISISFTCEGHTVDEIGEMLGLSGQLASEQADGKLQYEWLFKIFDDGGHRIAAIQPWVCEVVDGKIVKNQMLERKQLGAPARPNAAAAPAAPAGETLVSRCHRETDAPGIHPSQSAKRYRVHTSKEMPCASGSSRE